MEKSLWKRFLRGYGKLYAKLNVASFQYGSSIEAVKAAKKVENGYDGTNEEFRNVVVAYWKQYCVKPRKYWYRLFCAGEGKYDPRYIPNDIWYGKIIPYFNNVSLKTAYTDKNMLNRFFPDIRQPQTVIKNMAGIFYNADEVEISHEEAIALCRKEDHVIFKPAIESGGGKNIKFFDRDRMDASKVEEYFKLYGYNFIVQRLVEQHPDLARIHNTSLNTMRVMTLHFRGEVHVLSAQLRMGAGDARVDNYSSGGYAADIKPDGMLGEFAVNKNTKNATVHPCGLAFKDICVPGYQRVIDTIKRAHQKLPYFNLIGWDFAVDKDGEPVLIEFNIKPGQNQLGSKRPSFGDLTDDVLHDVFKGGPIRNDFM